MTVSDNITIEIGCEDSLLVESQKITFKDKMGNVISLVDRSGSTSDSTTIESWLFLWLPGICLCTRIVPRRMSHRHTAAVRPVWH